MDLLKFRHTFQVSVFFITFLFCQYLCYENDINIILMLLECSFEFKKCSFV